MICIAKDIKANTICKNVNCTHGVDGGRKHFYSCFYCLKVQNWKSVCCSEECYTEYSSQVKEARSKDKPVDLLADRTDMTKNEVLEIMTAPIDDVIDMTKSELKDYQNDLDEVGYSGVVEKINQELDFESTQYKSNYNKKNKHKK